MHSRQLGCPGGGPTADEGVGPLLAAGHRPAIRGTEPAERSPLMEPSRKTVLLANWNPTLCQVQPVCVKRQVSQHVYLDAGMVQLGSLGGRGW